MFTHPLRDLQMVEEIVYEVVVFKNYLLKIIKIEIIACFIDCVDYFDNGSEG
jgi:hypothetical protein